MVRSVGVLVVGDHYAAEMGFVSYQGFRGGDAEGWSRSDPSETMVRVVCLEGARREFGARKGESVERLKLAALL